MIDEDRSKEDLINELIRLRQRFEELEVSNTDQMATAKSLQQSEERFSKAFYSSPVAMSISSVENRIHLQVNQSWIYMFGYSREEAIGKSTAELGLWVSSARALEFQQELVSNGKVENFEMPYRKNGAGIGTGLLSAEIITMNGELCRLISITDITERKVMEEKLRQSENEKSDILKSITDAFFTFDRKWQVTYWNKAAENMFNVKSEEILGRNLMQAFPKYFGSEFILYYHQIVHENKPIFLELLGHYTGHWLEARAYPSTEGFAVYITDTNERKLAQEALRQSEEKFAKAFNCNPAPITITTLLEGRFVEVNDTWLEHTGYTRGEAIGSTGTQLGIWLSQSERDLMIKELQENGNIRNYNAKFYSKFGAARDYQVSADILDINDKPHLLCVHNDVTELNRVIAILRESEDKFSKAFHGLPIAAALVTLEEGRLMDVNDTFCTLFGYNSDEIINHTIKELNLYVNYDERSNHITKLLDEGKIENAEINLRTKSGEIRSCLFWSNSLKIESELYNITGIIDTTDQKWVEKEMARLDRLNMVGQMAASLGHEIRNPMTVVRGFIQLLSEQKCYAKDKNYFELMMEELDRANGILSEYLGMARDKIVELQPQYLDQVVKAIYPMLEADANYREMNIELDLGKPPMPLIDQKEIRQVILNLGRNGLEAMSSGGTLTIGTTVEGNDVVLFVKDEGPGMDPGIMDKLGTPFLTTKLNGSGLGLAVCYSIAARHNARLEFETSPQGTIIKMCFPQQKI